jgi:F-type H+-transporting ATPase subunit alpha
VNLNLVLQDFRKENLFYTQCGTIAGVSDGIAKVYGLSNVCAGELLEFQSSRGHIVSGMALNLEKACVGAVLFGDDSALKEGDLCRRKGSIISVPTGLFLRGRVIDPLGQPLDGLGNLTDTEPELIERKAPGIKLRARIDSPMCTGIRALDCLIPIGAGQRELIIGDRQVGKTALAVDAMIHQTALRQAEADFVQYWVEAECLQRSLESYGPDNCAIQEMKLRHYVPGGEKTLHDLFHEHLKEEPKEDQCSHDWGPEADNVNVLEHLFVDPVPETRDPYDDPYDDQYDDQYQYHDYDQYPYPYDDQYEYDHMYLDQIQDEFDPTEDGHTIGAEQAGSTVVYVAVGQKRSSLAQLKQKLIQQHAMPWTVIVAATASDSASIQFIAPYAGCTIAEFFRDIGEPTVIVYDDLSKQAVSYRQMSLLLRRPPGREAYPGDIFYCHSRLLERAANMGQGYSLTSLPVVETLAGDLSAYIPTNVISITDGQCALESELFFKGVRPAVNAGLSVSRVGSAAQTKATKKVANQLKLWLAQYRENAAFSQFASDLDSNTKKILERGVRLTQILKQDQFNTMHFAVQTVLLYAGTRGYLDVLSLDQIDCFIHVLSKDLTINLFGFIEIQIATRDFDADAEQEMQMYITDLIEFVQQEHSCIS